MATIPGGNDCCSAPDSPTLAVSHKGMGCWERLPSLSQPGTCSMCAASPVLSSAHTLKSDEQPNHRGNHAASHELAQSGLADFDRLYRNQLNENLCWYIGIDSSECAHIARTLKMYRPHSPH